LVSALPRHDREAVLTVRSGGSSFMLRNSAAIRLAMPFGAQAFRPSLQVIVTAKKADEE
jgi:hypothetical protein